MPPPMPPNWPVAPERQTGRKDNAQLVSGAVRDRQGHAIVAITLGVNLYKAFSHRSIRSTVGVSARGFFGEGAVDVFAC